ncbi:MlaD family protein [Nocardioides alcanivorans]|uniref:MlaD family protein n=1 Tax=Nocardioides alcanivorans TaxID=2897352 RepID=UPI001F231355|nr:MlaD family protein [Nocardioides alcanivorans]
MEKGVKAIAVKFGIFALVAILGFIALYNTMTNDVGGDQHTLKAEFENVSGLRQGDDVRISGVKVGRVEKVETYEADGTRRARVTMRVQKDQAISDTTHVTMRYQNLLGQKYLALTPGNKPGTKLKDGETIRIGRTSPGFDLTALLNGFEPLFNVLSPDDMNTLAENIVSVLQGSPAVSSSCSPRPLTSRPSSLIVTRSSTRWSPTWRRWSTTSPATPSSSTRHWWSSAG